MRIRPHGATGTVVSTDSPRVVNAPMPVDARVVVERPGIGQEVFRASDLAPMPVSPELEKAGKEQLRSGSMDLRKWSEYMRERRKEAIEKGLYGPKRKIRRPVRAAA